MVIVDLTLVYSLAILGSKKMIYTTVPHLVNTRAMNL